MARGYRQLFGSSRFMKLLLDTHTLLWAVSKEEFLNEQARQEIASEINVVFVSIASLWEIRIKESLGKIILPPDFYQGIGPSGFEILPITLAHLETLGRLPSHHRDPFDRMLIAQAQCEQLLLVSRDEEIRKYDVSLLQA